MATTHQRIGMPVPLEGTLFRNSALWEEPHLARLVVGGPAAGQVLVSQRADLVLAKFDATAMVWPPRQLNDPTPVVERRAHYSACEVGLAGRIYRTWMDTTDSPGNHLVQAILALADADPAALEMCRAA